jgi:hypothetical protein
VPFNPFKRKSEPADEVRPSPPPRDLPGRPIGFEGLTEEWRLVGKMHLDGRLSDALNRREAIAISDMTWAPIDGSEALQPAPGLQTVDPYDLIVVLTGPESLPILSEEERTAHKVHKIAYDVALETPPFRVIGTVFLYPGSEPARLMDRATEMFVPLIDAVAFIGDRQLSEDVTETILVNRFYLRGIEQIDRRTMLRHVPLPGQPLGGISWQDKSR